MIWRTYGTAAVDVFADSLTSHCPCWFSLMNEPGSLGLDALAHDWPDVMLYAFPPLPLIWKTLCRVRDCGHCLLLVAPHWPARPWASLSSAEQTGPIESVKRESLAPTSRAVETVGVAPGPTGPLLECSQRARDTVLNARAASMRKLYSSKWKVFCDWCSSHDINPLQSSVGCILDFLQHHLDLGRSASTLKVYVVALSAHRSEFAVSSLGSDRLIAAFLKGANRLCPLCAVWSPTQDLSMVLSFLCQPPFEPILESDIKWLEQTAGEISEAIF